LRQRENDAAPCNSYATPASTPEISIQLHRYNEPLADKSHLIVSVSKILKILPEVTIKIYTNGDYLNSDIIKTLAHLGVKEINATLHPTSMHNTYDELYDILLSRVIKLGFEYKLVNASLAFKIFEINYKCLRLQYIVLNSELVNNRGGSIDLARSHTRTNPCKAPFSEIHIEYDGSVLPCCNLNIGVERHKELILGKMDRYSNIYSEWASIKYVNFRRKMMTFISKTGPCASCTEGIIPDTTENRAVCELIKNMNY
jgi:MoaA/NifB/PqqE/SkfB family radical SAM enzyme